MPPCARSSSPSSTTAPSTPRSRSCRDGTTQRISSRPSDALALAARYPEPVPIFADEAVLEEAGVLFDQDEEESQIEEFREFLNQVRPEDFASE